LFIRQLNSLRFPDQIIPNFDDLIAEIEMPIDELKKAGQKPATNLLIVGVKTAQLPPLLQIIDFHHALIVVLP
jgi:hypothetical protein